MKEGTQNILNKYRGWAKFWVIAICLVLVNIASHFYHVNVDLTEDKRFSLTSASKNMIKDLDDAIYVKILLDGQFPSGFKRLQSSTAEILRQFQNINGNIQFEFEDPAEGTTEEIKKRRDDLAQGGIIPTSLKYFDGTQMIQKAIYPYAIVNLGSRKTIVNLLEEQTPGSDEDVILNNSISLLEYKFANAFQKLLLKSNQTILFTSGNGELSKEYTFRLQRELHKYYNTAHVNLDTIVSIHKNVDLVIVAAPTTPVSLKNQFKLDQYIMHGGKVLWLIEKLDASLDSIAKYKYYIPKDINNGLDDLLFKYGVRVQPDLIMDLECSQIPQIVGMSGDKPQTMLFPWYYHPAIASKSNHPIVKNIDRVNMTFPSSIDTLKTSEKVTKQILLSSSNYSKLQFNPMRLNFEILKEEPNPAKFNDGNKSVAVLLEGNFESMFRNRVSEDMKSTLNQLNMQFKEESDNTRMIVVSDVDFMKNLINPRTNETEEIGFNKWEQKFYKGNRDFIYNCIEYLLDEKGILTSRSKEIKLRLLDAVRVKEEKKKWQSINLLLPIVLLLIGGLGYHYYRRKKYA